MNVNAQSMHRFADWTPRKPHHKHESEQLSIDDGEPVMNAALQLETAICSLRHTK